MTVALVGGIAGALIVTWGVAVWILRDRLGLWEWTSSLVFPEHVDPFDVGASLVTATLLVLVGAGVASPIRALLALVFVSFVPGWALLGAVAPLKLVTFEPSFRVVGTRPLIVGIPRIALAVALSLTICTGLAQTLLWLQAWEPAGLLAALGGVSLPLLVARMIVPGEEDYL